MGAYPLLTDDTCYFLVVDFDEASWRGKPFGGAMFSPLHSNFMINTGEATAADLEGLGEAVRADVLAKTGVQLDWEIKRIGRPLPATE